MSDSVKIYVVAILLIITTSVSVNFVYYLLSFQRKMRFDLKKFFCILAILGPICALKCFWYEANTWYTDFYFWEGHTRESITLSWWEERTLNFYLKNNSDFTISGHFAAVDAAEIQSGVFVCYMEWQDDEVGKYISFQNTWFEMAPLWGFTGVVYLQFPQAYEWDYNWCIIYIPYGVEDEWYINSIPGKAIFISAELNPTAKEYQVKVFPGSRSKPSLANVWEIRFYLWTELKYSQTITWDASWNATFLAHIPKNTYTVVYKWQSHLASYLENFLVTASTSVFDFTTGSNLHGIQPYSNSTDNWYGYQIAWDLENDQWVYDFVVNTLDIAVVLSAELWQSVDALDPRDLNGDGKVTVDDLAIIWVNIYQTDPFYPDSLLYGLW